ncbi:hypothetical protein A2867_04355 [Candidatus Daviesbacteria bacterium RIFCSPHIGHO2_01_FULL_40_11]|uniref:Uncharacterized protein n=1 Tax=Candidatus Daviesbacteria bacterium RIFCSPHIGHO2_01_FULL_40_11 TaxID=1797762 RepID=A0A1F5JJ67_9BACT|nr:MAG: hypothetical protein A2867_04355 [Candidatus Daviesbacteria bacterium RIFCSPHIGHO2_01_FULL_40_11]OGE62733.1 MAG: hypothetical protein A2964_01130 [Candidatus Daviesbacteria bacterium RIFCSPLOWO2_01_FULL_40_27]
MGVQVETRIVGIDLDDCVLWREVLTRLFGHAKNMALRPALPKKSLDDIPQLDHTPKDLSIKGPKEVISAFFHFRRTAIPGVAEELREEIANGALVYGITGRKATKAWAEMTEAQLIRENIPLTAVYMTPKKSSDLESKADSIRQLEITDFYEDDRRTLRYLAKLFPRVRFNYINHGLAHLTEKELAENPNITVIPIIDVARTKCTSEEESAVRNSELRELTTFADGAVEWLHEKSRRRLRAWHLTALGVGFSILGIELAEYQNRTGKYSLKTTALAFGSAFIGAALDLGDGKLARVERSEMTDEKAKARHEIIGQALDPAADGVIEAWQAGSAAVTAAKNGDRFAAAMALRRLCLVNGPRTAKAIAGCFGIEVPETYRIKDVLHGDIRFFGTSLGRKIPNYLATLVNRIRGVSVQGGADVIASGANGLVTTERLSSLITPKGEKVLSDKEIKHAKTRAIVLGVEGFAFVGAAYLLGKVLLPGKKDTKQK